ncbi:flagellum biosynthesis protein FlbT [Rhodomicrobium udaipurense JA643]|uniref:Flagellar biosynthesis repressor FlbT n=1 Tax=Rhodomicrobium udaipurense TaxID=1202716 RepID=A0A8I1GBT5_9HYPH|nr:flagellar biosynthesis repressor FlbT [Rhodomicrobium udaipurense]KAI95108.1 flagellum biosynthesis protein FlbT [Rhodomicrobium udaipurense JA643]MBJ7541994.1 flagellar biosynthesis repressor FlbT [Rhodomicrobium udaipurense]
MTRPFSVSLKPGERIFINGAVLRADRKVSIEFLNDVAFLLEAYVMQAERATTPVRQLYFLIQAMLIDPGSADSVRKSVAEITSELGGDASSELGAALDHVEQLVDGGRYFDALKVLRPFVAECLQGKLKDAGKQSNVRSGNHLINKCCVDDINVNQLNK